ncbi:unnamed protein product [Penicillium salamii]|nr:unnamed protein product [Penicillium salamii]
MESVYRMLGVSDGNSHLHIRHCHMKYGPIIRYGPNVLIFNTVGGLKDIYMNPKDIMKDDIYQVLHIGAQSILTATDPKDHTRRAKVIRPAFSNSSIKEFEPKIQGHMFRLLDAICSASANQDFSWGEPLLVSDWCSYSTLDIITDLVFGRSSNLLGRPELRNIVSDIEGMLKHASFLLHAPWALLGRLDKLLFRDHIRGTRRYRQLVKSMMREAGPNQVYSHLVDFKVDDSEAFFKRAEICSEVALLVVAGTNIVLLSVVSTINTEPSGSDTTSAVLCALLFYLAAYPNAYDRLRSEIRHAFHSLEDIHSGPVLQNCTYLDACIKETMRISPGVSGALYRKVGKNGAVIDGHSVPAGTTVATGIYSLHHDEDHFPHPDIFMPERWLTGSDVASYITPGAYIPFSLGTRACLGRNLAIAELQILTTAIVWRFDFRFPQCGSTMVGAGHPMGSIDRTSPVEFQLSDYIVSHKKGPVLQFRQRVF